MPATPISTLAANVQSRLEETVGAPGTFWSLQYELYTALVEGLNDLMLLVGRPTQTLSLPFNLTPNSPWQTIPGGLLLVTDLQGPLGVVHKADLLSMDYVQFSWDGSWQNDVDLTGTAPVRWLPLGLNLFAIHPCVGIPTPVTLTGISYPTTDPWPYTGTETVPFHDEFFVALEEYAAHVARFKEGGQAFAGSMALYNSYLQLARRMTAIEDRRDPVLFSPVLGGVVGTNPIVRR